MNERHDLVSASCLLVVASALATSLLAAPPPPQCTPAPPLQTLAIPYTGLTSGCTNQPGSPNCIVGETIQFKIGDGIRLTDCLTEYLWQFESATVTGAATMNHQFSTPGTFTVTLTIIDRFGTTNLSQPVTVVGSAIVPTLSTIASVTLLLTIVVFACCRLR